MWLKLALHRIYGSLPSQTLQFSQIKVLKPSVSAAHWSMLQISRLNWSNPGHLEGTTGSQSHVPQWFFLHSFLTHPLCILPHLSQRSPHPSDCHIICLQFEAKTQSFPVMPPSYAQIPPDYTVSLCHIIYLHSKKANHLPPLLLSALPVAPPRATISPLSCWHESFIIAGCRRPHRLKTAEHR